MGFQNMRYDRNYKGGFTGAPYKEQKPIKKHSGCKYSTARESGKPIVYGWNYSKQRGLISFIASPYKGTKDHTSKSGKVWQNWVVKITNKRTLQETLTSGLFDKQTRKLILKQQGMVANPNARNGGYFGKF